MAKLDSLEKPRGLFRVSGEEGSEDSRALVARKEDFFEPFD